MWSGDYSLRLHGGAELLIPAVISTPVRQRAELVRAFQDDAGPPFFVISLKAGGSGLNLTAASHVTGRIAERRPASRGAPVPHPPPGKSRSGQAVSWHHRCSTSGHGWLV